MSFARLSWISELPFTYKDKLLNISKRFLTLLQLPQIIYEH